MSGHSSMPSMGCKVPSVPHMYIKGIDLTLSHIKGQKKFLMQK